MRSIGACNGNLLGYIETLVGVGFDLVLGGTPLVLFSGLENQIQGYEKRLLIQQVWVELLLRKCAEHLSLDTLCYNGET